MTQPAQQLACNGGPGTPKPGTAPVVTFSLTSVEVLLSAVATPAGALALAYLFAGLSFDAGAFCGDGDPGDPGMTTEDWADAIDYSRPQVNIPAAKKANQWFRHVIFPVLCDCNDGSAPPPNTPPPPPDFSTSPNTPPGGLGPNCWTDTETHFPNYANQLSWNFSDTLPKVQTDFSSGGFDIPKIQSPAPAGIVVTVTVGSEGSGASQVSPLINFYNAGHSSVGTGSVPGALPGQTVTSALIPIPATAVYWQCIATAISPPGPVATNSLTWTSTIYCQGQSPTSVITPCCPPDPSMDLRLRSIMDMLTQLLSLQALAGAYQETVHHNGLSGEGVLTINPASSAIRIDVVSDLTNWPKHPQTPTYYLSLGFITPFAVGTPLRGQRLIYNHQTFTWPSYTDQIGYTIATGLTVNIVELTRGA